jgi:hypothetical protein
MYTSINISVFFKYLEIIFGKLFGKFGKKKMSSDLFTKSYDMK